MATAAASFGSYQRVPYSRDAGSVVGNLAGRNLPSIDAVINRVSRSLQMGLKAYEQGRIGLAALRTSLQTTLRRGALAAAAVIGDWSDTVLTAVQRTLANTFEALDGFLSVIADRTEILQRDFIAVGQFAKTLFHTAQTAFQQWFLDKEPDAEQIEERRRMSGGPNCPDCIAYAALGWQPFGTLPEPGQDSYCGTHCNCRIEVRKKGEGEEAAQSGDEAIDGEQNTGSVE